MLKTFWIVLVTREGVYGKDGVNDDFTGSVTRVEGVREEDEG
jgi:hypothetical protein